MCLSRAFKAFLDSPPLASVPEHTGHSHNQASVSAGPFFAMFLFFLHLSHFRVVLLDCLWSLPHRNSPS